MQTRYQDIQTTPKNVGSWNAHQKRRIQTPRYAGKSDL